MFKPEFQLILKDERERSAQGSDSTTKRMAAPCVRRGIARLGTAASSALRISWNSGFKITLVLTLVLGSQIGADFEQISPTADYFRDKKQSILVNNWVIAKPNGNPITVMDVTKKMEVRFRQQLPQYAHSVQFRFQYYAANWRHALDELINDELILADAEEKKVGVSDGDIRKELEDLFGPRVVQTIDGLGMTHEEAWEMVKRDIIVNRMRGGMVHAKAATTLLPNRIRATYHEFEANRIADDEWKYRVLTIRHKKKGNAELAAQAASALLQEQAIIDLEAVKNTIEEQAKKGEVYARVKVSLSDAEQRPLSTLAESYQDVVTALEVGECSAPVAQVSRADNSTVYRIFYLEDHVIPDPPSFAEVEEQIKNQLFMVAAADEHQKYISKLREHFEIGDDLLAQNVPEDFEPFILD